MSSLMLIILAVGAILGLGTLYVALEVGLYLKWVMNQESGQKTDFSTYAKENEGGIIANYCG